MLQQQRRMKNSMTESSMEERKRLAKKEREKKASALAKNLSHQYPDELIFNLQPRQDADGVNLNRTLKRALGEFHSFTKVLKVKESHLLLGLDSTVPGTPEVNDADFETCNDIFSKPKNGINTHGQGYKKHVDFTKHRTSNAFAEPKGKAVPAKFSKPVAKPKPPRLEVKKATKVDNMMKNPNNIESILKEMTQPLPPALTDIETPGKGTSKMFRFPQEETLQPLPDNDLDRKPTENGGASQDKEDSTVKLEPFPDVAESNNTFKEVKSGKTRIPSVKTKESGKTKPSRKISTSSTSSSDDSSSDSSGSSDSENEKVEKQKTPTKKTTAINSPLNQFSPSKMHKTKSPFNNNNNYILNNKENNIHQIHPGLSMRDYAADISLKPKSNNPFPCNNTADISLNVGQVVSDGTSIIVDNPSLFPSPIGKTISPLDDHLFNGLIDFPEHDFLENDLLMPTKPDDDFGATVSTDDSSAAMSRVKTTNREEFKDPLDDSFESNSSSNLMLNKLHNKYKKDSKDSEKKPSTDERNKSSSKSNETKDKSKSKSTRTAPDSGPSVKVNSGSKGHAFKTKAELKANPPKHRRKSISESSDDSKSRKSSRDFKKGSLSEKEISKKEKKDRLKSKVNNREPKDVINLDSKTSPSTKKSSLLSSTPNKVNQSSSSFPLSDSNLILSKNSPSSSLLPLPMSMSLIEKDITPLIPPLKSPTEYSDLKVDDKCDLFLDKHETGNIFDTIKKSITNRISPLISPVCDPHDLIEGAVFDDPPIPECELKLEEIKEEDITGYESPPRFPQDLLTAVELKSSPLHTTPLHSTIEEENITMTDPVNDINFASPPHSSVNDMNFSSQPVSSVMDLNFTSQSNFTSQTNSTVNNINLTQENNTLDSFDFGCHGNTSINTLNFSTDISSSANKISFSPARNGFGSQANELDFTSQSSDQMNIVNMSSSYPPFSSELSNPIVNSQDFKPENTELLIDLDPYSVKDIGNIVPVTINNLVTENIDPLSSKYTPLIPPFTDSTTVNDITKFPPPKLTIKIPLRKLKNKYKKHHNSTTNDMRNSMLDSSIDEDLEIDVENDGSPLKRKRRNHSRSNDRNSICDIEDSLIKKDLSKQMDCEFDIPDKEQYEKLVVKINLRKLKRIPLKGVDLNEPVLDETRSPKERASKIFKRNLEPPIDVANTLSEDMVISRESSPIPFENPASIPSPAPSIKLEEMETENGHQNDVSQHDISIEKDSKRRSKKNKVTSKADVKPDVKPSKLSGEPNEKKNCELSEDVCRECGTLRKDYGRDSRRINSYKNTYREYFSDGSRRKHEADNSKVPKERAHKYIEAVLKYVQYLIGLELARKMNELPGVEEYMQITSECIGLVDYVITNYGRKEKKSLYYDVRFTLLCFRLQSILYLKLFKVKKESAMKYSKVLSRYFKQFKAAGHNGPTPYPKPSHNRGSTGTPSPSSPSPGPSPGGSVASVGSAGSSGSTGSNDITANGVGPFVTIPSDVHEKAFQHLQYSRNLLHGHLLWEDSELYASQCQPFLIKVSKKAGQLTMQSSMLHVVDYVTAGLDIIKELPPS